MTAQPPSDPAAEAEIALRERLCLIQKCITLAERDGLAGCVIRGSVLQWKAILADIAALRTARDTLAADLTESRAEVARQSARVDAALTEACQMSATLLMAGGMTTQDRRVARAVAERLAAKVRHALLYPPAGQGETRS